MSDLHRHDDDGGFVATPHRHRYARKRVLHAVRDLCAAIDARRVDEVEGLLVRLCLRWSEYQDT